MTVVVKGVLLSRDRGSINFIGRGKSPKGKCMLKHIWYSPATLNMSPHGHDFDGICTLRTPSWREISSTFVITQTRG